jgi:hypothetical protein
MRPSGQARPPTTATQAHPVTHLCNDDAPQRVCHADIRALQHKLAVVVCQLAQLNLRLAPQAAAALRHAAAAAA